MGVRGNGKTKQLIDLVNNAINNEKGSVICIERGKKLTYDINYKARLIDISAYEIESFAMLKGFICGLYSGNYDISSIFIDSLYKVASQSDAESAGQFLNWLEKFHEENGVQFTTTISAPVEEATDDIRKFF